MEFKTCNIGLLLPNIEEIVTKREKEELEMMNQTFGCTKWSLKDFVVNLVMPNQGLNV
jgi:hypothetical protein